MENISRMAREFKRELREKMRSGFGWFKYKNISSSDIVLPKPLHDGRNIIGAGQEFEADSYYQICSPEVRMIADLSHTLNNNQPKETAKNEAIEIDQKCAQKENVLIKEEVSVEQDQENNQEIEDTPQENLQLLTEIPIAKLEILTKNKRGRKKKNK